MRRSGHSFEERKMEDPVIEMLEWLFTKTEEEVIIEAEIAVLYSIFLHEDTRPERGGGNI
jgi:hypothetical protein